MVGVGLRVMIEPGVVISVRIICRLGVAEGQGCEGRFHGAIVRRAHPLRPQPMLMLEWRIASFVELHRRATPIGLPLKWGSTPPCLSLARRTRVGQPGWLGWDCGLPPMSPACGERHGWGTRICGKSASRRVCHPAADFEGESDVAHLVLWQILLCQKRRRLCGVARVDGLNVRGEAACGRQWPRGSYGAS